MLSIHPGNISGNNCLFKLWSELSIPDANNCILSPWYLAWCSLISGMCISIGFCHNHKCFTCWNCMSNVIPIIDMLFFHFNNCSSIFTILYCMIYIYNINKSINPLYCFQVFRPLRPNQCLVPSALLIRVMCVVYIMKAKLTLLFLWFLFGTRRLNCLMPISQLEVIYSWESRVGIVFPVASISD